MTGGGEEEAISAEIEIIVVKVLLAAVFQAFATHVARARSGRWIAWQARCEKPVGEGQEIGTDAVHAADRRDDG